MTVEGYPVSPGPGVKGEMDSRPSTSAVVFEVMLERCDALWPAARRSPIAVGFVTLPQRQTH